jgi:ABC-type cobalamin transport system ATPase subunit
VLILKQGRVLSAGKKVTTLNSRLLSQAFGERTELKEIKGRYNLAIKTKSRGVI